MTTGFSPRRFPDVREELAGRVRSRIARLPGVGESSELDLSDRTLLGELVSLLALRLSQVSERIATIKDPLNPDNAVGAALDDISAFAAIERIAGELDGALRARREDALAAAPATSWDRLYTALMAVPNVFDVALVDVATFETEIHLVTSAAVASWGDAVAQVLLTNLAGGTALAPLAGSVQTLAIDDSEGVGQTFDVVENQGSVDAFLTISMLVLDAGAIDTSEVARSALPPLGNGYAESVELSDGSRVTRFGYPIVRSEVLCRVRDAFPDALDVAVLVGDPALDFDRPAGATEAIRWDVVNFTIVVTE